MNQKILILVCMLFLHCYYDFRQGIIADMKQKSFWVNHPEYKPMYRFDYIPALLVHSFIWSFLILIPYLIYRSFIINGIYILLLITNTIIHAIVDNEKANKLNINLITDQICHLIQILMSFYIICNFYA